MPKLNEHPNTLTRPEMATTTQYRPFSGLRMQQILSILRQCMQYGHNSSYAQSVTVVGMCCSSSCNSLSLVPIPEQTSNGGFCNSL